MAGIGPAPSDTKRLPKEELDRAWQQRKHGWSMGVENELLEVQGQNGRRLHPRFPIGAGVLGSRPASVLLEEIAWLQE
jgi:hypothetical protein